MLITLEDQTFRGWQDLSKLAVLQSCSVCKLSFQSLVGSHVLLSSVFIDFCISVIVLWSYWNVMLHNSTEPLSKVFVSNFWGLYHHPFYIDIAVQSPPSINNCTCNTLVEICLFQTWPELWNNLDCHSILTYSNIN